MRFSYLLIIAIFLACNSKNEVTETESEDKELLAEQEELKSHFQIIQHEDYFIIEINTPFVQGDFSERYVVYPKTSEKPQLDSVTHYIPYPIESLAITSTTHVGFLSAINGLDYVKAANNIDWIYSQEFHELVEKGKIQSLGNRDLNHESLIQAEVDVILSYAIDIANYQDIQRLRELGQTVVLISEFMEQDPIQKASWLEVIGLLIGKQKEAKEYLTDLNHSYDSLRGVAMLSSQASSILMGFPWKGTWYMSGGKSFQAKLFKDAQGSYLWADEPKESGMPLDVETVLDKGLEADVWVNTNSINSLAEIEASDKRFVAFKAFQNKRVYNYNKRVNDAGGNDYWESGVVHPDWVLKDLIKIFHPVVFKEDTFTYYQKLE